HADGLEVKHLNRQYEEQADVLHRAVQGKDRFKKVLKLRAKTRKKERRDKEPSTKSKLFVLDFKGDIRATATASLRKEVSAVLAVATEGDQVLLRLENSGGTVHDHGLAASQLMRIKGRGIPLLV